MATVIDCATGKIVGWAMDDNYKTPLIAAAVKMAARNVSLPEGAVFHSDRGSNYTSAEFARELAALGRCCAMRPYTAMTWQQSSGDRWMPCGEAHP
jgi:transposase InsO family protein